MSTLFSITTSTHLRGEDECFITKADKGSYKISYTSYHEPTKNKRGKRSLPQRKEFIILLFPNIQSLKDYLGLRYIWLSYQDSENPDSDININLVQGDCKILSYDSGRFRWENKAYEYPSADALRSIMDRFCNVFDALP